MKILVLSDSHSALRYMRSCVDGVKPDAIIHLGDYYEDGAVLAKEYPHIPVHQVAGNCDRFRCPETARTMLCYPVGGVMIYMTHGHNEGVKMGIGRLLSEARRWDAQIALYGHTHRWDCHREEDGLWVMNPGSCGHGDGTAGLITVSEQKINCKILNMQKLEEMV